MVFEIIIYETSSGKKPYIDWFKKLKNIQVKAQIIDRLDRIKFGNLGDAKVVGEGVCEIRIHSGPGYRLYFAKEGKKIILLLCAGDKATQQKDIERAKKYLKDWKD